MRTKPIAFVILAASLVVSPLAVRASDDEHFPPGMMMGRDCGPMGMMGPGMMTRHRMMGGRMWRMDAEIQGRLGYLKTELEITDAQTETWKGYADAVAAQATAMQAVHQAMAQAMQTGGALERLDARISAMEAMLQSLKAVKPAVEKLYGALGAEQKKLADDLIGGGCGVM